jgi:hypothetical protein
MKSGEDFSWERVPFVLEAPCCLSKFGCLKHVQSFGFEEIPLCFKERNTYLLTCYNYIVFS